MTPEGSGYLKQTGWAQTMTERRQLQHDRNYFLCGFVLVLSCFWGLRMIIVGVKSLVGKESWSRNLVSSMRTFSYGWELVINTGDI